MKLKINEAKNLREDDMRPADNTTRNVYTLSLCAHTNCNEGSKYYSRHDDHDLLSHAKDIPGINYDTMEIGGLGYDDLSFTFEADSPATARKFAKRICAYAEPPCEECAMEYDDESTGSMVGPMTWEEFENADDFTDTLVTFEGLKKIKPRKSGKKLRESDTLIATYPFIKIFARPTKDGYLIYDQHGDSRKKLGTVNSLSKEEISDLLSKNGYKDDMKGAPWQWKINESKKLRETRDISTNIKKAKEYLSTFVVPDSEYYEGFEDAIRMIETGEEPYDGPELD